MYKGLSINNYEIISVIQDNLDWFLGGIKKGALKAPFNYI